MGGKALSEQMWQESLEMLKIEVLLRGNFLWATDAQNTP